MVGLNRRCALVVAAAVLAIGFGWSVRVASATSNGTAASGSTPLTKPYSAVLTGACLRRAGYAVTDTTAANRLPYPQAAKALDWRTAPKRFIVLLFTRNPDIAVQLLARVRAKGTGTPAQNRQATQRIGNVVSILGWFGPIGSRNRSALTRCLR